MFPLEISFVWEIELKVEHFLYERNASMFNKFILVIFIVITNV